MRKKCVEPNLMFVKNSYLLQVSETKDYVKFPLCQQHTVTCHIHFLFTKFFRTLPETRQNPPSRDFSLNSTVQLFPVFNNVTIIIHFPLFTNSRMLYLSKDHDFQTPGDRQKH